MTFSVCASVDGHNGAAIATHAVAVGSTAPFVNRHGAVCTQAMTKTPIGVRTMQRIASGEAIDEVVSALLDADDHPQQRQVHGIDHNGSTVVHTGRECTSVSGSRSGETYTIAGNMLTDESVLDRMAATFVESNETRLDYRLLDTLRAGEDAGGDKRGSNAQSAAVTVFSKTPRIEHDLRVDEHADAVSELERIHETAATNGSKWMDEYPNLDLQRHPY